MSASATLFVFHVEFYERVSARASPPSCRREGTIYSEFHGEFSYRIQILSYSKAWRLYSNRANLKYIYTYRAYLSEKGVEEDSAEKRKSKVRDDDVLLPNHVFAVKSIVIG